MAARVLAGGPLLGIGVMHLIGSAPMRPILEAANIPMIALNAVLAPVGEIVAGMLLLAGLMARVGGVMGVGIMVVALYAHLVADWPDEPPIALPIVVLLASAYVIWRGAGAWSMDLAIAARSEAPIN